MAKRLFTNNAFGSLVELVGASATLIRVEGAQLDNFPVPTASDIVHLTLQSSTDQIEIVRLLDRSGGDFTIQRGQDGTTPMSFAAGSMVELRITASALNAFTQADGEETVTAAWAFSQLVSMPSNPTLPGHGASKGYVDAAAGPQAATATSLNDAADAVNTTYKVAGRCVLNTTTGSPVWATGPNPTDPWNDASGTLTITPS